MMNATVDANIWAHAGNPHEERFEEAQEFVRKFREHDELCIHVDSGFSMEEPENRSQIGHEYLKHATSAPLSYAILQMLYSTGRCIETERNMPQGQKNKVLQTVSNSVDRIYVFIAFNTPSRVLVSHDYKDFPETTRRELREELDVDIVGAGTASVLVSP